MSIKCICFLSLVVLVNYTSFCQFANYVYRPDTSDVAVELKDIQRIRLANHITEDKLKADLGAIASDAMEGRETGQAGIEMAAQYLKSRLESSGFGSMSGTSVDFQDVGFTFTSWDNIEVNINDQKFRHLWDYLAFPTKNNSHPEVNSSEIIFLGYGISDPKYDDYKGVDVKNKVILINSGEPVKQNGTYWLTGDSIPSDWYNNIDRKLKLAYEKGVAMVLIIEEDLKAKLAENRRLLLGSSVELGDKSTTGVPYPAHIYVSTTILKEIVGKDQKKLIKARKKIEKKGKPANVVFRAVLKAKMGKKVNLLKGKNVIATLQGVKYPDEYIIVSAHYDHLGKRGDNIFNGADDNGSGTTAVLNIADAFVNACTQGFCPDRSIVFLWVCGEEKGLLGSRYYADNPVYPLENTMVNVNIDMVGRIDEKYKNGEKYIYVIGSDRLSATLHQINEKVNDRFGGLVLDYTYNDENDPNKYYYRSDHYNFAQKGIPAIFFFNGVHNDYHQPSDTVEKISFEALNYRSRYIFHLIWELANREQRLTADAKW